ncbi:molybdate ABC transporter permease subunit [Thioclava sp. GXIMD2076]|uniref:molybdate ABC transporter permease subunit n=1 Tax=unclassified Thioclava TaxID=2621713 RepID=UPI0030D10E86
MMLSPEEWAAIALSLKVSSVAVLCALPLAIIVALVLARGRGPLVWGLNALVHLPLILPPVVTGYILLLAFGRNGPIGAFLDRAIGLVFAFQWTGAALAAAVMGFPLMVRAIWLAIEAVDPGLEQAARTLGARPLGVFFSITLPLIAPGVIAGLILAFAKAMGEFGATITFVSNIPGRTQTLPSAIYALLQVPGAEGSVAKLAGISIGIAVTAMLLSESVSRMIAKRIRGS